MTFMYDGYKTWSPFVGCNFDCIYCEPSFKRQAKRRKNICMDCYNYTPHFHPERLRNSLGKNQSIFACQMGDVSFAEPDDVRKIFDKIRRCPTNTFLIQSKAPIYFHQFKDIPDNLILGTTIESDLEQSDISKAPHPRERYGAMNDLKHPRKAVTIEPIRKFTRDLVFWIWEIHPEIVWVGYANHMILDNEPTLEETKKLILTLKEFVPVKIKTLR